MDTYPRSATPDGGTTENRRTASGYRTVLDCEE